MSVVIIGTLDTKAEEVAFTRDVLEGAGVDVHLIDVGVMGDPRIQPDTTAEQVANAAGRELDDLREARDRGHAIDVMGEGGAAIASTLFDDGRLEGILGLGGSGNTSIATAAMRSLPVGVPKVMVSTQASGDTSPYVGSTDIAMFHSVADIEGRNFLTETILSNAAMAMEGMVSNDREHHTSRATTIGLTMFGVTTPCVKHARSWLEEQGYETVVFHATGTGGRAMETLIADGVIDAVLDVTTTEWADELVGGNLGAGPDRLSAAGKKGIPQVVSTGALDVVNFGPEDSVPAEFRDRTLHAHNPETTLMRTTPTENQEIGRVIAEKLNAATGPTAVALPLDGISMLDTDGEPFHDPVADAALFDSVRRNVGENVELLEVDASINDESFAETIAKKLQAYIRSD